jgi:hypothetical protein
MFLVLCLAILPASEAKPMYLVVKFDPDMAMDDVSDWRHVKLTRGLTDDDLIWWTRFAAPCREVAFHYGCSGLDVEHRAGMECPGLDGLVRPMSKERMRFHRSMHPGLEADGELFVVTPAVIRSLADKLARRPASTAETRRDQLGFPFWRSNPAAMSSYSAASYTYYPPPNPGITCARERAAWNDKYFSQLMRKTAEESRN